MIAYYFFHMTPVAFSGWGGWCTRSESGLCNDWHLLHSLQKVEGV